MDEQLVLGVKVSVIIFALCVSVVINVLLAIAFAMKHREAGRDHLTQLINQREFMRRFNKYTQYATRKQIPFAVLFVDLDHFKKINDRYSHQAGDLAIQMVGQRLRNEIKSTDLIARYGGEEFIICLKNCPLKEAENVASRLVRTISANPLKFAGQSIDLTISIGVASYPETSCDHLLHVADFQMYEAKRKGRNQIHVMS